MTLTQKIQVASSLLTPQIVCGLSNLILYSENEPIPSPRVNIISYDCLPDVYVHGKNLVYIAKFIHRWQSTKTVILDGQCLYMCQAWIWEVLIFWYVSAEVDLTPSLITIKYMLCCLKCPSQLFNKKYEILNVKW